MKGQWRGMFRPAVIAKRPLQVHGSLQGGFCLLLAGVDDKGMGLDGGHPHALHLTCL